MKTIVLNDTGKSVLVIEGSISISKYNRKRLLLSRRSSGPAPTDYELVIQPFGPYDYGDDQTQRDLDYDKAVKIAKEA